MTSRSIGELVASVRANAEAAAAAPAAVPEEYAGRLVELPELARRDRERRWAAAGIPERLWAMFHDGAPGGPVGPRAPQPTAALDAVSRFLACSDRTGLILAGPVDTGKTVAAAWGAAFGLGRLVKALDLVRAGLYPDDAGFWPRLYAEKLLVVDDLGAEPLDPKGYGLAVIADLIDRRYDAARKTIVTTNLPLDEFKARYGQGPGERLMRRFREVYRVVDLQDRKAIEAHP